MTNMKMKYTFLLAFITIFSQVNAQDNYINTTSSIPPSPTAASLGKYGDVPVSLYTGIPEINIPLYGISEGDLSLPVSLSYHSQGFKTEEMASYVGLGWSLNAGGAIARAVKGVPDDFNGDLWGTQSVAIHPGTCMADPNNTDCRFPSYGYLAIANDLNTYYPTPYVTDIEEMTTNKKDGEPDIFYFNFAGNSGQFVFNKDGIPKFFSKQNLSITYTRNAGGDIDKFTAIDGNGIIYYFETYEVTSSTYSQFSTSDINGNMPFSAYSANNDLLNSDFYTRTSLSPFISSWYLTKIKNPNSTHEINLAYVNETQQYKNGFNQQYAYGPEINNYSSSVSFSSIVSKKISEITWASGKLTFSYNHQRQDIGCNLNNTGATYIANYALTDVSIFNQANSLLKKYILDYNYFGTAAFSDPNQNTASNFDCQSRKLKLLSVKEYNSLANEFKPPYVFDYNTTVTLKPTYTAVKDFFGFQKETTPPLNSSRVPKIQYDATGSSMQYYKSKYSMYPSQTGSTYVLGSYDISPEAADQTAFLLTKITYPTGGSTAFEFEPHQFALFGINRIGGGARIKKITDYDGVNTSTSIIKNYTYVQEANPSLSSGLVMSLPTLAKESNSCSWSYGYTIFSNSISGLGSTFGSLVGYSRVQVEFNGNGKTVNLFNTQGAIGVASEECTGGSCIYQSTNAVFYEGGYCSEDNFPFGENPNFDWSRGALNEERIYNSTNQLVKKSVNEYTIKSYEKIKAIKVGVFNPFSPGHAQVTKYAPYYFLSGWKVLSKQTITEYDVLHAGKQMETVVNYFYDNTDHLQLTKTTSIDSKGQTFESIYKRSKDYTNTGGMINDLNNQHRLNEVIESQTWLQGSPKKLLSASFNSYFDYKTQNGLSTTQNLVQQKFQLETTFPLAQTSFQETWFDDGSPVLDPKYKPVVIYNYDNKDNLVGQSIITGNSQEHGAVIYGHNKSLAIAQVNNAKETDCGFTSFESDDHNLWENSGSFSLASNGHCGVKSCNVLPTYYGPTRNYFPSTAAQNKKFILSCWIKTNSGVAGTVGNLVLYTIQNTSSNAIYPNEPEAYQSLAFGNTNNLWKYIEIEIDLGMIKGIAGLPSTTNLGIRSYLWNTNSTISIQVDDIRLYPKDARMATYTYMPSIGVSSVSDENNDCQYYEYDTYGRLKLVKDQDGNILEKTDYNYKP